MRTRLSPISREYHFHLDVQGDRIMELRQAKPFFLTILAQPYILVGFVSSPF